MKIDNIDSDVNEFKVIKCNYPLKKRVFAHTCMSLNFGGLEEEAEEEEEEQKEEEEGNEQFYFS